MGGEWDGDYFTPYTMASRIIDALRTSGLAWKQRAIAAEADAAMLRVALVALERLVAECEYWSTWVPGTGSRDIMIWKFREAQEPFGRRLAESKDAIAAARVDTEHDGGGT